MDLEGHPERYRFLETVLAYAGERLEEAGEGDALRRAHTAYFLALAEASAAPPDGDSARAARYVELARDNENLHAAIEGALATGDLESALRMADSLRRYWTLTARTSEGRALIAAVLDRTPADHRTAATAGALLAAGVLAWYEGELAVGREDLEASLALYRELGDDRAAATVVAFLGNLAINGGDLAAGRAYSAESLVDSHERADALAVAIARQNLGLLDFFQGRYAEAIANFEEAVAIRERLGLADSLELSAWLDAHAGRPRRAGVVAAVRKTLGPAEFDEARKQGARPRHGRGGGVGAGIGRRRSCVRASTGLDWPAPARRARRCGHALETTMNFNSIMIGSDNPQRLADYYRGLFGEPGWKDEAYTGWQIGNGFVTVGPHDQVSGRNAQPGRLIWNIESADVPAEFARLKEAGATVVREPYHPGDEWEGWIATFADPDDNYFQLMSPM